MPLRPETVRTIRDYGTRYPSAQSAIIPALWAAQHEQGYVTEEAMTEIADALKLPPSLVEATATFYTMFRARPAGRHDVVVCVNAACSLRGADDTVLYFQRKLGVRDGQTTPDGAITFHSTIECLGACGGAPMAQVDHRFEENLTPEKIDALIERLRTVPAPTAVGPRGVAPGEGAAAPTSASERRSKLREGGGGASDGATEPKRRLKKAQK